MLDRVPGLLLGLLLLVGVASLSQVPLGHPPTEGLLRLTWRMRGPVVKVERAADPNVPVHMRPQGEFEHRPVPFALQVDLDGRRVVDREVAPAGMRGDRPLVVHEEWTLPPGRYHLRLRFAPLGPAGDPLEFDGPVDLRPGRITLLGLRLSGSNASSKLAVLSQ